MSGCWLWTGGVTVSGYGNFYHPRRKRLFLAHRAAYEYHHGIVLQKGEIIRHKCDNPLCVNPGHLLRGDHKSNIADMMERGRGWWQRYGASIRDRGEDQHLAKLTEKNVKEIRKMWATGHMTYEDLGLLFKVSLQNINYVVKRKTWKHVP